VHSCARKFVLHVLASLLRRTTMHDTLQKTADAVGSGGTTGGSTMMIASVTSTDLHTRDAVLRQLAWDSQVDASAIGVTAHDGTVTLTGFIDSYPGKLAAERAVKRIRGVRAVANDLQVRLRLERTDAEIAADAAQALTLRSTVPDSVQVVVRNGHLTLTGTAPTLFQRMIAESAVHHVRGVKAVVNRIEVASTASVHDVQRQIVRALHRDANLDARGIEVTMSGHEVRLTGEVRSWQQRESAERATMHASGITRVDNRIHVVWPESESVGDDEDVIC
jgi:osmotically-inducible protein OsmY